MIPALVSKYYIFALKLDIQINIVKSFYNIELFPPQIISQSLAASQAKQNSLIKPISQGYNAHFA